MKKLLLLATLFFIISCQENEKTQTIKIKNQYSLDLPESLSLATNLNNEASLQYQYLPEEFYVIVYSREAFHHDTGEKGLRKIK